MSEPTTDGPDAPVVDGPDVPVETTPSSIDAPDANPETLPTQSSDTPDFPTAPVVADEAAPVDAPAVSEEPPASTVVPEQPQPEPAPPVSVEAPVIEQPGPGESLEDGSVRFAGTAAAGANVVIYLDGVTLTSVSTDDTGNWSTEQAIATGPHTTYAVASLNSAVSGGSEIVSFTVSAAQETPAPDEADDPETALAKFLQAKILGGYPMRWDLVFELRQKAEAWLATRST